MKFNVCGGLDAPDWILAHMGTLSKIPYVRIKLLAGHIIGRMLDNVFEYEKVLNLSRDTPLGESEVKACVAVLHFFIANAAKFDIDDSTLTKELQQLGLPKGKDNKCLSDGSFFLLTRLCFGHGVTAEHSDALCKPYLDNKESLQAKFLEQSLQVPALRIGGWQVQLAESKSVVIRFTAQAADQDATSLSKENDKDLQVCLAGEKLHVLLLELKSARVLMEDLL